ncbi:hypothetical protein GCM10011351_22860 [Paraliobacillus quinghaiensis]|uniref:Uncharacterized protein n=1 Tax=Paraliobacillus quinghaiensis TaxID=470815 RepID=A0A917TSL8_9BACI|nr:hypothetical protein [Paraliobacillus quinghaiensis]GGM36230.1 hypothetical protein GCM10011351_22860 [Paraliobacillus quinghaiensis]
MQNDKVGYHDLINKLQHQEQAIAQLVTIVATTNRKLSEIERKQLSLEQSTSTVCSTPSYIAK